MLYRFLGGYILGWLQGKVPSLLQLPNIPAIPLYGHTWIVCLKLGNLMFLHRRERIQQYIYLKSYKYIYIYMINRYMTYIVLIQYIYMYYIFLHVYILYVVITGDICKLHPWTPPEHRGLPSVVTGKWLHLQLLCRSLGRWFCLQIGGFWLTAFTPWKINMERTNHPFRKEIDLPNLHDYVPC